MSTPLRAMVVAASLWGGAAMAEWRVSRGSPAVIVVEEGASPTVAYAAGELRAALKEVTGAELPVVHRAEDETTPRFVIGPATAEALRKELGAIGDDAVLVKQEGSAVYLTGADDRSALYATYTFLERHVGVRWLWPGKDGEYYPRREEVLLDGVDIREKPSLQYRALGLNDPHFDEDTLVWMARQRMNVGGVRPAKSGSDIPWLKERGFLTRIAGHNVVLPAATLKAHPEWIAQYGGARKPHASLPPHLCWANPGVQQALKAHVTEWVRQDPAPDIVALYTADHNGFCECDLCTAMAPDVSTRWQKLSRILIEGIREAAPHILVHTLAYQGYRPVPAEIAPYDMIGYTTYNISYRHPFSAKTKGNESALGEIRRWQALGGRMGLRGYEMIAATGPRAFLPLVYLLRDEMAYAAGNGLLSYSTEVAPYGYPKNAPPAEQGWNVNRLNLYAVAKLMWNASMSEDDLLDDWCAHAYGPAAPGMKAYYQGLEKAWRAAPGDVSYFLNPSPTLARTFMSDALVAESRRLLETAAATVKDEPFYARAVQMDREMFKTWDVLNGLRSANELRSEVAATKVAGGGDAPLATLPWGEARPFPAFIGPKGEKAEDATEVRALWDEGTLYLRVICHESQPQKRIATRTVHDDKVWSDDSVELFITNNAGGYDHLAVNSLGTRYEARSEGGMSLETAFSPEWRAEVTTERDRWVAFMALPLSWVSRDSEGAVAMSIKRTRPQRTRSGWPEASYHNPSGAGRISLPDALKPRVLLYDAGRNSAPLFAALRRDGWSVARVEQVGEEAGRLSLDGVDIASLFLGNGKAFHLSIPFFHDEVRPFVENGGVVIVGASTAIPMERWFETPDLALRWSGWGIAKPRVSSDLRPGAWLSTPHDLRPLFRKGTTPSSALIPTGTDWTPLASLAMRDGTKYPYLLAARMGEGLIVVTSSNFGYGGGYEIFGERNTANIVKLMENIYANRATLIDPAGPTP